MGKLAGYGGHRNVSPCQSSRPQNRFFGRKFSSRSIRIVANVQLQTVVAVGRGVSLDRLFVGVATQEEIVLQYSILSPQQKCCPVHYDLNAKLIVIETLATLENILLYWIHWKW